MEKIVKLMCTVLVLVAVGLGLAHAQEKAPVSKPAPEAMVAELVQHQQAVQIQELEVTNLQLQVRLEQTRLEARAAELKAERPALEEKLKKALGAPAEATVDWTKRPAVVVWPAAK